ncbi:carbamate kinase [Pseudovibrio exalbescens]|uniref:carbamate kinase n=1 Tax=Pseudovibrio exalbescens TaxID=197461 RepID=UPI000C9AA0C2|nr:carbamate kinase [Pseudovibrio exalbescens]
MRIVVALGGNAILQRGEPLECDVQRRNIQEAARSIARLAEHHQVVLNHGNGPQVGLLALMSEAYKDVKAYPLDALGAQTQGLIGFMFEQELRNAMPGREVCTLSTQTVVDPNDPAFENPSKYVGPIYREEMRAAVEAEHPDWVLRRDGNYWRRVVPSPKPIEILELASLRNLIDKTDSTVICGGGGGVPVTRGPDGVLHGVEAVIDKDRASRLLAEGIDADAFLILSDVKAVATDFGRPGSRDIHFATPDALERFDFPPGSMGPKVEAVCQFVRQTGKVAAIGALNQAAEILEGKAGTIVKPDVPNDLIYYEDVLPSVA